MKNNFMKAFFWRKSFLASSMAEKYNEEISLKRGPFGGIFYGRNTRKNIYLEILCFQRIDFLKIYFSIEDFPTSSISIKNFTNNFLFGRRELLKALCDKEDEE